MSGRVNEGKGRKAPDSSPCECTSRCMGRHFKPKKLVLMEISVIREECRVAALFLVEQWTTTSSSRHAYHSLLMTLTMQQTVPAPIT